METSENVIKKDSVEEALKNFILKKKHPCVMAQTVFKMEDYDIKEYVDMGSASAARDILRDLENYLENYDFSTNSFATFIAAFPEENIEDELTFEKQLWQQLNEIHKQDKIDWDPTVSSDPQNSEFSFSILGKAFYIVGLHPNSSRMARRAPFPSVVFNLHFQFEQLREMNTYKRVRDRIRRRDKKLQGSINPMLADFGHANEALQYSGRKVDKNWECPFKPSNN